ncbi:hypothetical protein DFH29DRAFT_1039093 [Suillus ampliporus]|nr:hypothetical protein DFH29DRAFT_1039093 [Suillus ampliporus]
MYYTTIPLISERPNNRRWDASKLCELRKRLDSGTMTVEETDQVAGDFLDGEIVDLASDWLGNMVGIPTPSLVAMARGEINLMLKFSVRKDGDRCSSRCECEDCSLLT